MSCTDSSSCRVRRTRAGFRTRFFAGSTGPVSTHSEWSPACARHWSSCSTGGCETVQRSDDAELLGVPVAALGLAGYLFMGAAAAIRGEFARSTVAALALGAAVFSGYLLVVQLVVIHAVCDWCLASDAISSLIAVIALARVLQPDSGRAGPIGRI